MDMDPDEMRRRANLYRQLASTITDARAIRDLSDLADEYEAEAEKVPGPRGRRGGRVARHRPAGSEN
jgi:hypothetical protein